jgi:hypothetical protein
MSTAVVRSDTNVSLSAGLHEIILPNSFKALSTLMSIQSGARRRGRKAWCSKGRYGEEVVEPDRWNRVIAS